MSLPPRGVILDIEGTTTPISFVYEHLFPFARKEMEAFLSNHWKETAVQEDIQLLRQEQRQESESVPEDCRFHEASEGEQRARALTYALWLMDRDRKATGLKSLQGKIWKSGYASGKLLGEVFPDVASAFERWKGQGRQIAIYSSGSVAAQKLLFAHSTAGDLTKWIDGYFDTRIGHKREPQSYESIAQALAIPPNELLFATDVLEEANAAGTAGMQPIVMDRPGNPPQKEHSWPVHQNFESL